MRGDRLTYVNQKPNHSKMWGMFLKHWIELLSRSKLRGIEPNSINEGKKCYKVTRRLPEMSVAETIILETKEEAISLFENWLSE